jgi:hypothetical protein
VSFAGIYELPRGNPGEAKDERVTFPGLEHRPSAQIKRIPHRGCQGGRPAIAQPAAPAQT